MYKTQKKQSQNTFNSILFTNTSNRFFFICSVIFIIVLSFAVYVNSINNEFTNWDDPGLVVNNTTIRSLDFENIKRILTPHKGSTFQPIRVLSYAIDYHFWKLNKVAYHIHNILFHTLAGIFLFFTMVFLLPQIRKGKLEQDDTNQIYKSIALITAILFIVHPINVESVTWISGRKYVELSFFTFVSLFFFVKSSDNEKYNPLFAFISLVFSVLAVLSSPFGIVTPGLFFLFDFCRDKSNNPFKVLKKRLIYYLPYVVFCLIFIPLLWIALVSDGKGGANTSHLLNNPIYTFFTMLSVVFDYAVNLSLPLWLNNRYPTIISYSFFEAKVIIATFAIITMIIFVIYQAIHDKKIYLFCLGWFLIAWSPASNIIPISTKIADRYIYIAAVGPLLLFTYELLKLFHNKLLSYVIVSIVVIFFSIQTIQRNYIWSNSKLLWTDSLEKNYNNLLAHYNLAKALENITDKNQIGIVNSDDIDKAIFHYIEAIKIDPHFIKAYNNVGLLFLETKEYDKAINYFNKALEIEPNYIKTNNNIGLLFLKTKKYDKAINYFNKVLEIEPNYVETNNNIGLLFLKTKKYDKAINYFNKALEIEPDYMIAHKNLGIALVGLEKFNKAISVFSYILRKKPDDSESHFKIAEILSRNTSNKHQADIINPISIDKAIFHYLKAIEINPDYANSYNNVGILFFKTGIYNKAVNYLSKAVKLEPDSIEARKNLGIALFHMRKFSEAVIEFSYILEKNPSNSEVQYSLGNVYFKLKDYKKAYKQYANAVHYNQEYSKAYYNLGVICQIMGNDKESVLHFNTAYKLNPALKL